MIPLTNCKNRHLYKISSRNLIFGVFNSENNGFVGIREKFGDEYLFTEYHWDTGAPFGTVKPTEDLGEVPENLIASESIGEKFADNKELFDFLKVKETEFYKTS